MRLPSRRAGGLVLAGFGVAAQEGHRSGVQGTVEISIAGAAETVPCALAAAGFQRRDSGQRGKCRFASDASGVGPADEQLGRDDRSHAGFGM